MTKTDQPKVVIFDTTLRDGEQSPGATMTHEEKLEIASLLDEMGVDVIEAGFPIASEGDFAAVSEIAKRSKNSTICGLSRANFKDIDRCWEAVKHATSPRIHTFIGTSPLHRAIPNLTMDEMAERIHDTVTHARNLCDNVQWSAMDATRTEHDYLCRVVEIAIKAGATTINIPDTVGYTAPRESADLIAMLLALAAIARRKKNVLILVHRKPLMDQWRLQISSLLGIDKKEVGQIGGGRFPLILTERREHLNALAQLLEGKVENLFQLHGGIRQKGRKEIFERIRECSDSVSKTILATGSYIGEGFDDPRLDTLFLTMPSSFKGKIIQYAGRLHRYHKDKSDVRIYDYVDANVSVLATMYQGRLKTYKMLGYEVRDEGIS